jgi:hypothetical protein
MCSCLTFHILAIDQHNQMYRSIILLLPRDIRKSFVRPIARAESLCTLKIMQNGWGRSDVRASESGSQSGSTFWPPRGGSYEVVVTFNCFPLSLFLVDNTHFFLNLDIQSTHTQWLPPTSKRCDSPSRTPSSSSLPISMAPSLSRTAMISW